MNKIKILFLLLFFTMFISCEDFLNRPPLAALTTGVFPSTESDALLATNAVYNTLRTWHINTGGFPLLDIVSDEATKGSNPGDAAEVAQFENFTFGATGIHLSNWYKTLYLGIRRANLVINKVPLINMDTKLRNRFVGEAKFLRAYFYYLIYCGFGDAIIVLNENPPLKMGQSPKADIANNVIIPDLIYAYENLPEKNEYVDKDLGRITKGAARGLLARFYLFLGKFAEVEKYTKEIINSGVYSLEPNFSDIFSINKENGSESIWEIGALAYEDYTLGGNQYGNTQGVRGTPNKGWGFLRPSYKWIKIMYDNNDPRLDASVIFKNEIIDGVIMVGDGNTPDTSRNENGDIIEIEAYSQKVYTPGTTTRESFEYNRRMIRYADVLLMAAEALNENGKSSEALTYLNMVRSRARGTQIGILPDITTTDQTQLKTIISNERTYELAFEGLRFWDLIRTNKAYDVLKDLGFKKDKNELFPIPQSEIDISEGLLKQNNGY